MSNKPIEDEHILMNRNTWGDLDHNGRPITITEPITSYIRRKHHEFMRMISDHKWKSNCILVPYQAYDHLMDEIIRHSETILVNDTFMGMKIIPTRGIRDIAFAKLDFDNEENNAHLY